jgi:acid phosphatase class B
MRNTLAGILSTAALLLAVASPAAAAPSERACNQGTEHAHHTVPDNPAHAHIPEC